MKSRWKDVVTAVLVAIVAVELAIVAAEMPPEAIYCQTDPTLCMPQERVMVKPNSRR